MEALTPSTAARAGLSRSGLYRRVTTGEVERIARGVYLPADALDVDWNQLEAATRRADATICLTSALAVHDLTDEIPTAFDVAIPRGSRRPAGTAAIAWHLFDKATFDIGREQTTIPGSTQTIGIYSAERTIADAFRLRGGLGYEPARDALREWLRRGGQPAKLMRIAMNLPRAKTPILQALEALT